MNFGLGATCGKEKAGGQIFHRQVSVEGKGRAARAFLFHADLRR